MQRITNEMTAIMKSGDILVFGTRKEYDAFLRTREARHIAYLFATPRLIKRDLDKGAKLELYFDKIAATMQSAVDEFAEDEIR